MGARVHGAPKETHLVIAGPDSEGTAGKTDGRSEYDAVLNRSCVVYRDADGCHEVERAGCG